MKKEQQVLEGFQELTRSDNTKLAYLSRAEQLLKRAKKELNITFSEDIDVRQFVVWLADKKQTLARTAWRQYKSAVVYYLENHENVQASTEALEYLKEITSVGALTQTQRTSSLKLKKITFDDWQKLDSYLKVKNNKWHPQLRDWLRASIITGLRPVEWYNSILDTDEDGKTVLRVKNAKTTNGRAHGENRTLIISDISTEDLNAIKSHLNTIRTFKGMDEYDYFYRGCAMALYKACRRCWPKRKRHITLYSTRHQFSSNAKSSGFSKLEVAAMMGHAVDVTATIHYGRKQAGNESLGVSPDEADVSKVRAVDAGDFKTSLANKKLSNFDILKDLEQSSDNASGGKLN